VRVLAGRVAEDDLAVVLDGGQHLGWREPAAGGVLDRDREDVAGATGMRPGGLGVGDRDADLAAEEAQSLVRQQRAGQHPGLAEDLEAVADPEPGTARRAD